MDSNLSNDEIGCKTEIGFYEWICAEQKPLWYFWNSYPLPCNPCSITMTKTGKTEHNCALLFLLKAFLATFHYNLFFLCNSKIHNQNEIVTVKTTIFPMIFTQQNHDSQDHDFLNDLYTSSYICHDCELGLWTCVMMSSIGGWKNFHYLQLSSAATTKIIPHSFQWFRIPVALYCIDLDLCATWMFSWKF